MTESIETSELSLRVSAIKSKFDVFEKSAIEFDQGNGLVKMWMGLKDDLEPAIKRAKEASFKHDTALVLQFADAFMSDNSDRKIIDTFLDLFGASSTIRDNRGDIHKVPASSATFRTILNNSDLSTDNTRITLDTDIKGVRILADGSAITDFDKSSRSFRPMLLVDLE